MQTVDLLTSLQSVDQQIIVAVNGAHCTFLDHLMWLCSSHFAWTLIVLTLLFASLNGKNWRTNWRKTLTLVGVIALAILLADQISSSIIKPLVARPRPTHNPAIESILHIVRDYRGGAYGFVSSHAANCIAVTAILHFILRNKALTISMTIWTAIVCYSRMYLGVHYLGDILGGLAVGLISAMMAYQIFLLIARINGYYFSQRKLLFDRNSKKIAEITTLMVGVNLLIICAISILYVL